MAMTYEFLKKFLEYTDARIAEKSEAAAQSSDGGLAESVTTNRIRDELMAMLEDES